MILKKILKAVNDGDFKTARALIQKEKTRTDGARRQTETSLKEIASSLNSFYAGVDKSFFLIHQQNPNLNEIKVTIEEAIRRLEHAEDVTKILLKIEEIE